MTAVERRAAEGGAEITSAHERILRMAHLKFLGIYFQEADGVMGVQGRALEKAAMRVVGQLG
jgi:hypothetical protein